MTNNNTYKIWTSATHSTKSNFYKILNAVISGNYSNSYKLIESITLNQNTELNDNIKELFLSVTNIPEERDVNLFEILALIYDETNEGFKFKIDETLPYFNADETTSNYIILTADKDSDKVNMIDDDSGYYLRISANGQLFCFPTENLIQALTKSSETEFIDAIGKDGTRTPLNGYAANLDGSTNYIQCVGTSGDTVNYTDEIGTHTTTLDANLRIFEGIAIRLFKYDVNGEYFDINGLNPNLLSRTGVVNEIKGDNLEDVIVEDERAESRPNQIGYGILNSEPTYIIPLGSDNLPVAPYDVVYTGRVKYNAKKVNGDCFVFTAGANVIAGMTGLTVSSFIAESGVTPVIIGDNLTTDVNGWVAEVTLSNGAKIPFIGSGTNNQVYNVNAPTPVTPYVIGGTINSDGSSWGKQNVVFPKSVDGFGLATGNTHLLNNNIFIEPTHNTEWYVRPLGGSYGLEDGTSYDNAFNGFTAIDWGGIGTNDLLYVCDTHTQTLVVGNSNVIIKDYGNSLIDGNNIINCVHVDSKMGVYLIGLTCTRASVSNFNIYGTAEIIGSELTATYSGNQNYQHLNTAKATYYNIIGNNGVDDGVSQHDTTKVVIYGGVFNNNAQGINIIAGATLTAYDVTTQNNTQYDLYVTHATSDKSCVANIYNLKSNGYSFCQLLAEMNIYYSEFDNADNTDHTIDYGDGTILNKGYGVLSCNIFKDIPSGKYGLIVNQYSDVKIYNNIFDSNLDYNGGIATFANSILESANNIYQHAKRGIYAIGGIVTSDNDLFHDCSIENVGGTATVINDITADPLLNADYTPTSLSPCINSGITTQITDQMTSAIFGDSTTVINYRYCGIFDRGAFVYLSSKSTMPASLTEIGKDVQGNTLTNPPTTVLNGGCDFQDYVSPEMVLADVNNQRFDTTIPGSATAKILSVTDFVPNFNDYSFANIVEEEKDVKDLLMYSEAQSEENIISIIDCYNKGISLSENEYWITNNNDDDFYDLTKMARLSDTII